MSALDAARPVRAGEELDTQRLQAFFAQKLPQLPELQGPIEVEQFPRGHSNLTYLLKVAGQEVVLRKPPRGAKQIRAGHDMGREYRMLTHLRPVYPKV
ncbi:MAG TPA: phosphotransferase family protein, partial [Aggregicoccus sp.]|nr:phosphotransferase family protein [Aggregicoccus sp.]